MRIHRSENALLQETDILLPTLCPPCLICPPCKEVLMYRVLGDPGMKGKYKAWICINSNTKHGTSNKNKLPLDPRLGNRK